MFMINRYDVACQWNGKKIIGTLSDDVNGDWAIVDIEHALYIAALDKNGETWWLIPYDSRDPELVKGPYTYEQVVAIMRLLS